MIMPPWRVSGERSRMNLSIISTIQQEIRQSERSQNILRYSTIGNGVRDDLDTYHLLFMNGNSMREGRQHEYYFGVHY